MYIVLSTIFPIANRFKWAFGLWLACQQKKRTKNEHEFDTRTKHPPRSERMQWHLIWIWNLSIGFVLCLFICTISSFFFVHSIFKETKEIGLVEPSKIDLSLCNTHAHTHKGESHLVEPSFSYRITNCYLAMKLTVHFSVSFLFLLIWAIEIQHHNKLNIIAFDIPATETSNSTHIAYFHFLFHFLLYIQNLSLLKTSTLKSKCWFDLYRMRFIFRLPRKKAYQCDIFLSSFREKGEEKIGMHPAVVHYDGIDVTRETKTMKDTTETEMEKNK